MAPPYLPLTLPYPNMLSINGFPTHVVTGIPNKPPFYVACQFGVAYFRPWQRKGKKSGSIRIPEQTNPVDGVLVYHIVSAQPFLIPKMLGFITTQSFWGCTTFLVLRRVELIQYDIPKRHLQG